MAASAVSKVSWTDIMNKKHKGNFGGIMARIYCPHCQGKLLIETSKQLSDSVRDIYGTCINETCLARPVMTVCHKSDRTTPLSAINGLNGVVLKMLEGMTEKERKNILEQFNTNKTPA